ncbi:MAG: hypothetical protein AAF292_16560 [Pseudomonadota bacterium]
MSSHAKILFASILGLGAAASASAQNDIVGAWTFETERYHAGVCRLYGTMKVRTTPEDGVYRCALTAVEDCKKQERWVVEQTCSAYRADNTLSVRSTIVSFIEADVNPENYVPDHFALEIEGPDRMIGSLVSAVIAPVEFRRTTEGIS